MKHWFWLCVCVLLACVGCTNDLAPEKLGSTKQAGTITTFTFTQSTSTTAPFESFDLIWTLSTSAKAGGTVVLYNITGDYQMDAFEVGGAGTVTRTVSLSAPAAHTIEARYSGNLGSNTKSLVHTVSVDTQTSIFVSATENPDRIASFVYGEPMRVQTNVSSFIEQPSVATTQVPTPSPNGTVKLTAEDGTDLGTCDVVNGTSDCEVTGVPVSKDTFVHGEFTPSVGSPFSGSSDDSNGFSVSEASTTTTIASATPEPSVVGATVSFTVEVHPVDPSTLAPKGTIQLFRLGDASPTASAPVIQGTGKSSVTIPVSSGPILAAGMKNVQAVFVPDANWLGSTSSIYVHNVGLDVTQGALVASPASTWTYGEPVTFSMTVSNTAPGAPAATGSVFFYDGAVSPSSYLGTSILQDSAGKRVASFTTSNLALNGHSITAVYQGDASHASVSATTSGDVQKATPSVDVLASPSNAVYSRPITLGVHVTGGGSSPPSGGKVQFYVDGTTKIGAAVALDPSGFASIITSTLDVGTNRVIKAVYNEDSGDTRYAQAENTATVTITDELTNTVLTTSNEPATAGGSITLTATVTKQGLATATPKGNVVFSEGASMLGTVTVNGAGIATLTIPSPSVGTHEYLALFDGDPNFADSQDTLEQTVVADGVTTSLVSSPNPSIAGAIATFTATFTSVTAGPATGTVTFFDGATSIGTAPLAAGVATFTTSSLSAGSHTIKAAYAGDATHSAANATVIHSVTRIASTTAITTTAGDATLLGAAVPLKATVTSTGGGTPSGTVLFKDGDTVLAALLLDATGSATFTAATLAVGPHSFTATFDGDPAHLPSTSAPLTHTVEKSPVTVTVASSLNPAPIGFAVLLSATITGSAAGFVPTGSVTFKDGATTIGSGSLNASGVAQLSISTLGAGAHSITATFSGDAHFLNATSAALSQSISATASAIALSSAPNPSALGASVTLTVSISGGSATPTGSVTFKNGGSTLGTGTLDTSGKATFSTSTLPAGILTLSVEYAGDASHDAGTASTSHVVQKGVTTTTLTASATTAAPGTAIGFSANVSSSAGAVAGDVELFDATTSIGTATLASGGASFSISNLTAGQHAITARYKGSDTFATSLSNTIIVTIGTGTGSGDGGADGGGENGSSGGASSSSGASGTSGTPVGTGDSGAGVNTSGGLDINPGSGNNGGDDCAMTPGGTGTLTVPFLIGLIAVLARRRRKVAA